MAAKLTTMERHLWVLSVALGAISVLFVSLGVFIWLVAIAGCLAIAVQRARLLRASGVATGFGWFWTLLQSAELLSGSWLDNAIGWLAVGLIPFAMGLALLAVHTRGIPRQWRA